MSDPTRLLDEPNASPALHELLSSARHDGPSADDLARLARRLGPLLVATAPIGAAAATSAASSAATTTTAAATTKVAAATAIGTQVAAGAGVIKIAVIAAVGGTVLVAGSFQAGRKYEAERVPPPKVERVAVRTEPVEVRPEPVRTEPVEVLAVTPEPVPEPEKVAKPKAKAPPPEPKLSEVELLEKAMAAMRSGDAKAALALTARHQSEFPSGALAQEREMLAIEALVKTGRGGDARMKAVLFREKYPTSSHLLRLDALVGR